MIICLYLSNHLSINPSIYQFIHLSIHQLINLFIYLFIHPSIHLFIHLSIYQKYCILLPEPPKSLSSLVEQLPNKRSAVLDHTRDLVQVRDVDEEDCDADGWMDRWRLYITYSICFKSHSIIILNIIIINGIVIFRFYSSYPCHHNHHFHLYHHYHYRIIICNLEIRSKGFALFRVRTQSSVGVHSVGTAVDRQQR